MESLERLKSALANRYTVERMIGAGGMADVYLTHDVRHNRKVAIKVMHRDLAELVGVERFLREIETTAKLQHPHILPLFDSGSVDGTVFYVMPYVEGESLRSRLKRKHSFRLPTLSASPPKLPLVSPTPTATASSIAISNRTTCCFRMVRLCWRTLASHYQRSRIARTRD